MIEQRYQFAILLLVIFVAFVGSSIPYTIFPPLFIHAEDYHLLASIDPHYRYFLLGVALAVFPLGQFLGAPILGAFSDRYGRKRVLIFSLVGSILGYLLTVVSLEMSSLWLLISSRFFTGLLESNFGIVRAIAANFEHISKYKSIGGVTAAASIGYVVGPLLGGFFSDPKFIIWFSAKLPFYIALFLSVIAFILAQLLLKDQVQEQAVTKIPILEYFNLFKRIRFIMKNRNLKYLLIISTTLTLAVDIFYEFGPIYLTGRWHASPLELAFYNGVLSISLAVGNGWLAHRLSRSFHASQLVKVSILVTSLILFAILWTPYQGLVYLWFSLIGLSNAVAINVITVEIAHTAEPAIQGEVMGTQFGLKMLGNALICFVGGFLIMASWSLPFLAASVIALISLGIYNIWLRLKLAAEHS